MWLLIVVAGASIWRVISSATENHWLLAVWALAALAHRLYVAKFHLADRSNQPLHYEGTNGVLVALDLLAHIALACFCGLGWAGVPAIAVAYFAVGGIVGTIAESRARMDTFALVQRCELEADYVYKAKLASTIFEARKAGLL